MKGGKVGFIGDRLREAREARGLSGSAVAELLGLNRGSAGKYERGDVFPSPEVVARLSDLLRVPPSFFFKDKRTAARDILFYRSMSGNTKSDRLKAERKYEWLKEVAAYVKGYVRIPAINLPNVGAPSDPVGIDYQFIEAATVTARRHWGLGDGPISDVMLLMESNGIIVSRLSAGSMMMDGYSSLDGYSGCAYVVLASDKGSAVRSRFDLAHELGHLILHRHLPLGFVRNPSNNKLLEDQAHAFAGAFLMPEESFAEDLWIVSLDALKNLKQRWLVSIGAMLYRAGRLGWLTEEQQRGLWINYSRRGWKRQEPLDDTLQLEKPRILSRGLRLIVEKGGISASRIVSEIGLHPNDIDELAGLEDQYFGSVTALEVSLDDSSSRDLKVTKHYELDPRRLNNVN